MDEAESAPQPSRYETERRARIMERLERRTRRRRFERLVAEAMQSLPESLASKMSNVEVLVADVASPRQLAATRIRSGATLLGLYEGIPLTRRGSHYGMVLPDRITIFRLPLERMCRTDEELRDQIRRTVIHEFAHHFGIDDARLTELGWG